MPTLQALQCGTGRSIVQKVTSASVLLSEGALKMLVVWRSERFAGCSCADVKRTAAGCRLSECPLSGKADVTADIAFR